MFDTWTMLRNWVHRGGPWTGSKEVVHGPGPKGWSMDLGSMFCIRPMNRVFVQIPFLFHHINMVIIDTKVSNEFHFRNYRFHLGLP